MTSRAMLLPTCGDPYITQGWVDNYKKFCSKHVDQLHVFVNSLAPDPVFDFVVRQFEEVGANVIKRRQMSNHGAALTRLVQETQEDILFFNEEDFLVFDPSVLNKWYRLVESGKYGLVGSMRGCCRDELIQACVRKFNLKGPETRQPNFWPALVVVKRSDVLKTDLCFIGPQHKKGVCLPQIDYTPHEDMGGGDTFAWMSMQLRSLGLKVKQIYQHRFGELVRSNEDSRPWIHLGGGSSTLNGRLLNKDMTPLGKGPAIKKLHIPEGGLVQDFERKIGWWKAMREAYPIPSDDPASYFNKVYSDAINRSVQLYKLNPKEVDRYASICRRLVR